MCRGYFQKLFKSSNPKPEDIDEVLDCVEPRVSPSMRDQLDRPFSTVEVRNTLWQMHANKSLGPDDSLPTFPDLLGCGRGFSYRTMFTDLERGFRRSLCE